jgi:uncharacterized protein
MNEFSLNFSRWSSLAMLPALILCFSSSVQAADHQDEAATNAPASKDMAAPLKWGAGTKVLLVGGGTSHDFQKWFGELDGTTLSASGKFSVNYTESSATAAAALAEADVLVLSTNQKDFDTPRFRTALMSFAAAGKGIILLHPAVWYNWPWPEYNAQLVGGGSRSHETIGEFEVNVIKEHPVTRDLPETFKVVDELYRVDLDPGVAVETLAQTSTAKMTGRTYPSIWVVKHPAARIVAIALGHDGRVHELPEYKKLIRNSVAWVAGGN